MNRKCMNEKMLRLYRNHLCLNEKSENTIEKYLRDIKSFSEYAGNAEICKETVLEYKKQLQAKYKARSVNSMLASINSFFTFLGWHECKVKQLKLQRQIFCPEEREMTKPEYERLCRAAEAKHNKRLSLLLQTICGTGIRVSELQFITVEAAQRGEAVVALKGKTRSVFIVKALKKKLLRYAAEQGIRSGLIFITKAGNAMNRTNIWREMKNLCAEAGVNPNGSITFNS